MMLALISPTFSLKSDFQSCSPLRIFSRASLTHPGQSESVSRGHPSGGLVFCQDFRSGLSDHLGVNEGLGLYLLKNWIASKANPAAKLAARSTCFMSRCALVRGIFFPTFPLLGRRHACHGPSPKFPFFINSRLENGARAVR